MAQSTRSSQPSKGPRSSVASGQPVPLSLAENPAAEPLQGGISRERAAHVLLILIVAVAAYLRFRDLGDDSIWLDEAASWIQATSGSAADVIAATARDNYPPLHNLILWALISIFGDSEWVLRLPSAVFGVLNVIAIYWVATLIRGRMTGLIAALLLALSGFHIWYSQEARMYALLALAATVFAGTVLRLCNRPSNWNTAPVILSGVALLYSHPYGALTWISIVATVSPFLIWRPVPGAVTRMRWAMTNLIAIALFLPWAWVLLWRADAINRSGFWIDRPTLGSMIGDIQTLLTGPYTLAFFGIATVIAFVKPATSSAPILGDLETDTAPGLPWMTPMLVLLAWALGPVVLGYLASILIEPVFLARYLLGSLPAFLLLAAVGMSRVVRNLGTAVLATLLVVAVSVHALSNYTPSERDDWRSAAALIAEGYDRSICLVFDGEADIWAFRYYVPRPFDCIVFGETRAEIRPGQLPSDFAYLLISGGDLLTERIVEAFEPGWDVAAASKFKGIDVIAMVRTGS